MPRAEHPSVRFARNLTWLIRHINGEQLKQIGKSVGIHPDTISRAIKEVAPALVEHAQSVLMKEVFPLTVELYRVALQAEIEKVKGGKEVDFKLIDKLMKGLQIIDRPFAVESQLPTAPGSGQNQLGDGVETLAGFVMQRTPPPRIADRVDPIPQPQADIIDGEVKE